MCLDLIDQAFVFPTLVISGGEFDGRNVVRFEDVG
ncbi:hypothetical protein EV193_105483, partial [Herbihabitans rhizosphaerae]